MISISTAYWPSLENGQKILDEINRLGFSSIEISSYTGRSPLEEMLPTLRRKGVTTVSLHNPCPKYEPRLRPWENEGPEPQVTAETEEEREAALALVYQTMELAADLEAQAIVLHLGTTQMPDPTDFLKKLFDQERTETDEGRERILELLDQRIEAGEAVWDGLCFSLENLTQRAERLNLFLGIENRIYLHEFPVYGEIDRILAEFAGGNFRYWHDVGHATVHQNLGLVDVEEVLSTLGKHVIGLHIHDAKGYADHIAPGQGDTDYAVLIPHLRPETLRVVEVHPQANEDELTEGLHLLNDVGIV